MVETPLVHRLRTAGERITPQRKLIAQILQERGGHLSAEDIYRLARTQHPRLALATVYRTLRWLKESGLVHELQLNDERSRYEMGSDGPHQHMVCLGCGRIIEFVCDHCSKVHRDLAEQYGFQITGTRVKLFGYCAECQKRRQNQSKETV